MIRRKGQFELVDEQPNRSEETVVESYGQPDRSDDDRGAVDADATTATGPAVRDDNVPAIGDARRRAATSPRHRTLGDRGRHFDRRTVIRCAAGGAAALALVVGARELGGARGVPGEDHEDGRHAERGARPTDDRIHSDDFKLREREPSPRRSRGRPSVHRAPVRAPVADGAPTAHGPTPTASPGESASAPAPSDGGQELGFER